MAESRDSLDELYARVAKILEQARGEVARTINTAMVQAYWHVGREIVEVDQAGERRAEYGEALLKRLSKRLAGRFGSGFGTTNLREMRRFYLVFPNDSTIERTLSGEPTIGQTPSGELLVPRSVPFPQSLSWSHYVILMRVPNEPARAFYEVEAAREAWSVRELQRQIGALLFDGLAKNKTTIPAAVRTSAGMSLRYAPSFCSFANAMNAAMSVSSSSRTYAVS
jgi:hypothetical protein